MDKIKRILIVTSVFAPEPITSAKMNLDLANRLACKYDVTVITPYPSRPQGFDYKNYKEVEGKFKLIRLQSYICPESRIVGRFKESYSFGQKCVEYIKQHHKEIDFIYNDGWQLIGLYKVAKVCYQYDIPYLVPIQDIYPESLLTKLPNIPLVKPLVKSLLSPMDNYYIKHAACVRTISEGMVNYLSESRHVGRDKFLAVANWQNDDAFDYIPKQKQKEEPLRFMFLGNNNAQANVDLMIRAFVDANLKNAELYIMGQGSAKKQCMQLAEQSGNKHIFFDEVPQGKTAEVQSKADVMVLALKQGTGTLGIPSKLTAYMLSGKPVIASIERHSDTADIILNNHCGRVTKPDSVRELALAFEQMSMMSTEDIEVQGQNSYKYAKLNLSKESNLNKVCLTIEKILNNHA